MPDPPSRFAAFIAELRHRRVFRVAIVYAGVAFIIIQIIDGAFDYLRIPEWVGTTIIVLLLIGFPIAVALAWAFDITEKGIVRTRGKTQAPATSRRPILTNWTLGIVAVLAIIVAAWSLLRAPSPGGAAISSIAVLPLNNQMGDPEQEYFVEGMHDAIITELSRISALKVISRNSVMYYKDKDILTPEIAQQLNVDAVVEGSVFKAEGQVRITAQLIDGRTDRHLWADAYEQELREVLILQKTVARAIANEIGLALKPEEEAYLASAPQVNPEAYEAYLKGRYFWNKRTEEGLTKGLRYFEQAIEKDPGYALAYAGLADAYLIAETYGILPPEIAYPKARVATSKALEIDIMLAEAHCSLAWIMAHDWNWKEAETEFKYAAELNPNYANAPHWYAVFLSALGRHEEAIIQVKEALKLDPLSLIINDDVGWVLFLARKYDEAIEQYQKTLNMDPNFLPALHEIGLVYEQKGMFEKAISAFQKMASLNGDEWNASLAHAYALSGDENQAREILAELIMLSQEEYVPPYDIATVYVGLESKDEAFSWLEKAHNEQSGRLLWINVNPRLDLLRSDPRFQDLLLRMNFPE